MKMLQDFKIVPDVLSKLQIFEMVQDLEKQKHRESLVTLASFYEKCPENVHENIGFSDFVQLIVMTSSTALSSSTFDDIYSSSEEKLAVALRVWGLADVDTIQNM